VSQRKCVIDESFITNSAVRFFAADAIATDLIRSVVKNISLIVSSSVTTQCQSQSETNNMF
jgi:hypothetical protein